MTLALPKSLAACALSLVLGLTAVGASTTQARADADDAARILGGIIALYAIGRALDNRGHAHQPHVYQPEYHGQRVAPARCYREFQTRNGYFRGYAGHCLQRHTSHGLPDACARQYHTQRGLRTFYGGRCMVRNGWVHG